MRFSDCCGVGLEGVELVMRWLAARNRVFDGRMVRTDKGRLSLRLQREVGDILFNSDRLTVVSIEVKTESRAYDTLFLETWSNASPQVDLQRPGWMHTLDADWLFYYFIPTDDLCTVDFQRLRKWAFTARRVDGTQGRIFDFPEREQRRNAQRNVTKGRCVPISVLATEVGLRRWRPNHELMVRQAASPAAVACGAWATEAAKVEEQ